MKEKKGNRTKEGLTQKERKGTLNDREKKEGLTQRERKGTKGRKG